MEYGLVAVWLVMYFAVGIAALPLSGALFSRFHDGGAAFAIPVGLATVGIVGYLVGQVAFGWPALLVALAVLVLTSAGLREYADVDERAYAEAAVVFAVAFCFVVAIRSASPAIAPLPLSTGEKFLDYGLLRTLLQTGTLPPEDMWFAGESVRYYYGGHMLAALLTLFTGTAPQFGYNLALAGFYASLVTAAYGLTGAIAANHDAPPRIAAGFGAFFVGIAGNLETAGRMVAWLLPESTVVAATDIAADADVLSWTPTDFSYWDSSRVIDGTINEFPLFSWLNGDLHAHMMSTPFLLVVAALCYSYWRTPETEPTRRRLRLAAVIPVAGLLAVVNTWSFPTAGGLILLTVAFAPADPATLLPSSVAARLPPRTGLVEELRRDGVALAVAVAALLFAGLAVLPFWLGSASSRGVGLFPPRSGLGPLLLVHGGFLLVFGPYLAGRLSDLLDGLSTARTASVIGGIGLVALGAWLAGFAAVALFGPLLVAAWLLLRRRTDVGFETLLVLAGVGLVLIVEFAHVIEPQYQGSTLERLNTVFKTYMQVWVLWAPAAGVALARLLDPSEALPSVDTGPWRTAGVAVACVVILTTGLYAGFAVPAQLGESPVGADGPTLDGTAYTHAVFPEEAEAIEWIDAREGQPTIVTAAPGGYWWRPEEGDGASAPASLTGNPTVLGWFHEEQYRGEAAYERRLGHVTTIYEGSTDEQTELLDRYGVEYVYVGPAERNRYDLTIEDHPALEVAFQRGDVVVYEVRR